MSHALATDQVATRIDELDLEPIVFKMMNPDHGEGLSLEAADRGIARYRAFLKLCAMYPGRSIVPTAEIDHVWHTHILDTAKYRYDCDRIFGHFLDHFPYLGLRGEEDAMHLAAAFMETKELFLRHFGDDLSDGVMQACGDSCGGSLCENPACSGNSCQQAPQPPSDRLRLSDCDTGACSGCGNIPELGQCTDCIGEALARMRPRPVRA